MTATMHTLPPSPADEEHPLVAVLNIFAPGITDTLESAESEREGEDDRRFIPYDAVARRLAQLGLS
ncbi:hypothetical protein ABZ543_15395 [Streptomyces roseifaciens]